jgi:hypothetical protein
MPGRLDRVAIRLESRDEPAALSWDSRNHLLARIRGLDGLDSVLDAFKAASASSAVTLTQRDKVELVEMIDHWSTRISISELPAGVWDLRCRLVDDLRLTQTRAA